MHAQQAREESTKNYLAKGVELENARKAIASAVAEGYVSTMYVFEKPDWVSANAVADALYNDGYDSLLMFYEDTAGMNIYW
jgi:hypothetical protein